MAMELTKNAVTEVSVRTTTTGEASRYHTPRQANPAKKNARTYHGRRPVHSIKNATATHPANPHRLDNAPYRNAVLTDRWNTVV